jgi:hypothetical protein
MVATVANILRKQLTFNLFNEVCRKYLPALATWFVRNSIGFPAFLIAVVSAGYRCPFAAIGKRIWTVHGTKYNRSFTIGTQIEFRF